MLNGLFAIFLSFQLFISINLSMADVIDAGVEQNSNNSSGSFGYQWKPFQLKNGIEGVVVSVPKAKISSASVSVNVGYFDDPNEFQGMAHYLEHTLFLGSAKYPVVNDYGRFIKLRGGETNAYTGNRETNFQIEILPKYFEEGLDRFSDFFKNPLFDEDFIERERTAVDNEFHRNLQNDGWRARTLMRGTSQLNHPIGKFSIGSKESLAGVKRKDLESFYLSHYSAGNMKVVLMGPQNLDQLLKSAEKYFGDVPKREINRVDYPIPQPTLLPKQINMEATEPSESLSTYFYVPKGFDKNERKKTINFFNSLVNSKAEGSLYSLLRAKQLGKNISSDYEDYPGFYLVVIDVELAEKGSNDLLQVKSLIFAYLNQLKTSDKISEYQNSFEDSLNLDYKLLELNSDMNTATKLASDLQKYLSANDLLSIEGIVGSKISKEKFYELMDFLTLNKASFLYLTQKKDMNFNQREPIWNINYSVVSLPDSETQTLLHVNPPEGMELPQLSKEYRPQDFKVIVSQSDDVWHELSDLENDSRGRMLIKSDKDYGQPTVYGKIKLISDQVKVSNETSAASLLIASQASQLLSDWLTKVKLSGNDMHVAINTNKIEVTFKSYPQIIPILLSDLWKQFNNLSNYLRERSESDLAVSKQDLLENILDEGIQEPYKRALHLGRMKVSPDGFLDPLNFVEGIKNLKGVNLENQWTQFLTSFGVDALLYGNIDENLSRQLYENIFSSLKPSHTLNLTTIKSLEVKSVPFSTRAPSELKVKETTKNHNHVYYEMVELGSYTNRNLALVGIIERILDPLFYNELRTHQQTGYIVQSVSFESKEFLGLTSLIQSGQYDADDLGFRVRNFYQQFISKDFPDVLSNSELMSQISYAFDVDLRYTGATSIDHFNWLVNRFEDDTNYTRPKEIAGELATLTPQEFLTFIKSSMGNDESGMAKRLEIKVDPTPQGQVPVPTLEGK